MAIHGEIPGIEVTVRVAKKALTEYNVENDPSIHPDKAVRLHEKNCTVTSFIESMTGKTFTIMIKVKKPYHMDSPTLCFCTHADGQIISKPLMRRANYTTRHWSWEVVGPTVTRSMVFSEIVSTSNGSSKDEIEEQKEIMNPVGDIVVKVYRMSEGKQVDPTECTFKQQIEIDRKYHEKALAKDAKTHGTILGGRLACDATSTFKVEELDGNDYPIAVFVFKYRCEKALQDLGLVPKPQLKLHNSLDLTQLSRLSPAEQEAGRENVMRVLQMLNCVKNKDTGRVMTKRESDRVECAARPTKRQRVFNHADVIDLTEEKANPPFNMPSILKHGIVTDLAEQDQNVQKISTPRIGLARCIAGGRHNLMDLTWTDFPL